MTSDPAARGWRTPWMVLICGATILTLSMGSRQSFGLFLTPMSTEFGWGRSNFAFAMALSNLLTGAFQPLLGGIADRYGAGRVVAICGVLFAAGVALTPLSDTPLLLDLTCGVLTGIALSGIMFGVVLGVVGRAWPAEKRSFAFGIATAGGSVGQFLLIPFTQWLIHQLGWKGAVWVLAGVALAVVPLALGMVEPKRAAPAAGAAAQQSFGEALREAGRQPGFWMLTAGYFVCGFHVAFIQVHLPSYLNDVGLPASVGAAALALIGLCNIAGSFSAGWLGGRYSKKHLLFCIYAGRALVIGAFLVLPPSAGSVFMFAAGMGFLWLSTVPLTNGLVAQVFGTRYLAMLGGIVFFSHQVGAFLGVWLGGRVFDATGSYDTVWLVAMWLAVFAALINLPIDERPLVRRAPAAA
ncbi:MAG: MFS transporter [Burkholderiales bacterium]|jgi:predicted MFS family arabinose efflux permease|nr:MFS transporter [Burkholderiales bacterium]